MIRIAVIVLRTGVRDPLPRLAAASAAVAGRAHLRPVENGSVTDWGTRTRPEVEELLARRGLPGVRRSRLAADRPGPAGHVPTDDEDSPVEQEGRGVAEEGQLDQAAALPFLAQHAIAQHADQTAAIEPVAHRERRSGAADGDDVEVKARRDGLQRLVDQACVVGVHRHRHAQARAARAHRVQRFEAAEVRADKEAPLPVRQHCVDDLCAVHAHVDRDLSDPPGPTTGRHPLPDPARLADAFGRWGIDADAQVVAYDDAAGQWAARAWWLLRDMGHGAVAVLDGGLRAWQEAGLPLSGEVPDPRPRRFDGQPGHMPRVAAKDILENRAGLVVDVRAAERYRGEAEPIDPVAGHIPHAVNVPYLLNVNSAGRFLAPKVLREVYRDALGGVDARGVAAYCGSGVTAPHAILALEVAGMPGAALYAGSWSEWIRDEGRPVERGEPQQARA